MRSQVRCLYYAPEIAIDTTTSIDLLPAVGTEPKPYVWIDPSRFSTATRSTPKLYTTEGVYGVCARGATQFAEPPDRTALMRAAFGSAVVAAGIFAAREMPDGATLLGGEVYFVVHARGSLHGHHSAKAIRCPRR